MKLIKTIIQDITFLSTNIVHLTFFSKELAQSARPGNFLELQIQGKDAPLLRRPFGIHRVNEVSHLCEIIFKIVGEGSLALSKYKTSDPLNIIAPLGNSFEAQKEKIHLIVGGGMGIAPLLFFSESLASRGEKQVVFLGAKDEDELIAHKTFSSFTKPYLATDNASLGEKTFITEVLKKYLNENNDSLEHFVIYACGPRAMTKSLIQISKNYKIKLFVSLEERMACGLGVCQGCAVEVKNMNTKYKLVCKDGPIFYANDLVY